MSARQGGWEVVPGEKPTEKSGVDCQDRPSQIQEIGRWQKQVRLGWKGASQPHLLLIVLTKPSFLLGCATTSGVILSCLIDQI
jgi:hypothetical protein